MKKVIAIQPGRVPAAPFGGGNPLDTRGREMRDLRISVTDRSNFRCPYCMPREVFDSSYRFLPHEAILTFEEIARLAARVRDHAVRLPHAVDPAALHGPPLHHDRDRERGFFHRRNYTRSIMIFRAKSP